jgi:hypothetical protein
MFCLALPDAGLHDEPPKGVLINGASALEPSQGLETTVEESTASITRELERAVSSSNRSFKEAAEGRCTAIFAAADSAVAAASNGGFLTHRKNSVCLRLSVPLRYPACVGLVLTSWNPARRPA